MEKKAAPDKIDQTNDQARESVEKTVPEAVSASSGEGPEKESRMKKVHPLVWCALLAVIILIVCTAVFIVPGNKYKKAAELYSAGRFEEAQAVFEALGSYKDSGAQAAECANAFSYEKAQALFAEEKYTEAQAAFEALGSYKDSAAFAESCHDQVLLAAYTEAERLLKEGNYAQAQAAFEALGDYSDSVTRAIECANRRMYEEADALFERKEYEAAANAFSALGEFQNASERALAAKYAYVKQHENGEDKLTRSYLPELKEKGYQDSAAVFDAIVNKAGIREYTGSDSEEYIEVSFYLLPGETVTAELKQAEDIVQTNEGEDWLEMKLQIPKKCYYPGKALSEPEYTVSPKITVIGRDGSSRELMPGSFTILFPAAAVSITEPAAIPKEGVMCREGNVIGISGIAPGEGITVTVNGVEVSRDEEGRFTTEWTLPGPEKGTVTVTASGDNRVTASVGIPVLPYEMPEPAMEAEYAEPHITFVPEECEMFSEPRVGTVISPNAAAVFSGPGEEYDEIVFLGFGERIDALGTVPGWYLVEYREGSYGWTGGKTFFGEWMFEAEADPYLNGISPAAEYAPIPQTLTVTASAGAGLCVGPDDENSPFSVLSPGTECVCIGLDGDMYLCVSNGVYGWINKNCFA